MALLPTTPGHSRETTEDHRRPRETRKTWETWETTGDHGTPRLSLALPVHEHVLKAQTLSGVGRKEESHNSAHMPQS